jgi:hypothetical protein
MPLMKERRRINVNRGRIEIEIMTINAEEVGR